MATGLRVLEVAQSYPRHATDPHGSFVATHVEALCSAGAAVGVLAPSMPGTRPSPGVVRFRYGPRRWEVLAGTGAMHHAVRGPADEPREQEHHHTHEHETKTPLFGPQELSRERG